MERARGSSEEEHDGHHDPNKAQNHEGIPEEGRCTVLQRVRPTDSLVLYRTPVLATEPPPYDGHCEGQSDSAQTD